MKIVKEDVLYHFKNPIWHQVDKQVSNHLWIQVYNCLTRKTYEGIWICVRHPIYDELYKEFYNEEH